MLVKLAKTPLSYGSALYVQLFCDKEINEYDINDLTRTFQKSNMEDQKAAQGGCGHRRQHARLR